MNTYPTLTRLQQKVDQHNQSELQRVAALKAASKLAWQQFRTQRAEANKAMAKARNLCRHAESLDWDRAVRPAPLQLLLALQRRKLTLAHQRDLHIQLAALRAKARALRKELKAARQARKQISLTTRNTSLAAKLKAARIANGHLLRENKLVERANARLAEAVRNLQSRLARAG